MTEGVADAADPQRPELRARVLSGFIWKLASVGLSQVLNTVVFVALARLLAPKQLGIAAMAMVATAFVITYSNFGLGAALVQKPVITETDRSTVFWASTALGAIMAGICVAIAPLVAAFYHTPEVASLLEVLSLSFLFTGLGSTHRELQFRAMNFRVLEIRLMAAGLVGGVATLVLAVAGAGPWAIIVGDVASAAVSTALLLALGGWRPHFIMSLTSLRELGGFGLRFMGGATFTTLNSNADNILVGRVLGQAALGTYGLAYSVILVPLTRLAWPVAQLLAPAFSRLQHDRTALADSWLRGTRLMLMVFLPAMLTVAVTAPDLVHLLFGSKWDAAIPVIRILAPVCAILSIQATSDIAVQAVGAVRTYLWMCGLSFALNIAAFVIGIQWGLVGMATAFGISTLIFMTSYLMVVAGKIGCSRWRLAKSLRVVLSAALALLVVEVACYAPLRQSGVGPILRVGAVGVCGVAAYALVCALGDRDTLVELLSVAAKALRVPERLIPRALQTT